MLHMHLKGSFMYRRGEEGRGGERRRGGKGREEGEVGERDGEREG